MKIAVLSGKGGTGKTFISVNMAVNSHNSVYVDCDVEEPNGHIFLNPSNIQVEKVFTKMPSFNCDLCNGCRHCIDFCAFNALAFINGYPKIFPDICHSCGGCSIVCNQNAVTEVKREVGCLKIGERDNLKVVTGFLNLGEASAVPVINAALNAAYKYRSNTIIDCPPGSSCSVMESIKGADYCVIVTEPTAFGLHNFKTVYELCHVLSKKCGVVINKSIDDYPPLTKFCTDNNIPVLLNIPYSKDIANTVSKGKILCLEKPEYSTHFKHLLKLIRSELQ